MLFVLVNSCNQINGAKLFIINKTINIVRFRSERKTF